MRSAILCLVLCVGSDLYAQCGGCFHGGRSYGCSYGSYFGNSGCGSYGGNCFGGSQCNPRFYGTGDCGRSFSEFYEDESPIEESPIQPQRQIQPQRLQDLPPAPLPYAPMLGKIIVHAPESSMTTVINDKPTAQSGATRKYVVALQPGKRYAFTIRVGAASERIILQAGDTRVVDFTQPAELAKHTPFR